MAKSKHYDWITEKGLTLIEGWAFDGLTEKQIAEDKMGISERTLSRWKNEHKAILSALKKGKEFPDREVEGALRKRAVGYDYEETETFIEIDDKGKEHKKIRRVKKHMPPDTAAIIFYLKNRKPDKWRNNPEERQGEQIIVNIEPPPRPEVTEK